LDELLDLLLGSGVLYNVANADDLKKKLQSLQSKHDQDVANVLNSLTNMNSDLLNRIQGVNNNLQSLQSKHDQDIANVLSSLTNMDNDLLSRIQELALTSYIVYKGSDGNTYVKNGETGAIEYSSSDDASAIQYAINQASATGNGGTVFIKAGVYNLSRSINPMNNVKIVGEGMGKTVLYSLNAPAIWADSVSNFSIEELTVDRGATSEAGDSAPNMGMVFFSCSNVLIRRVEVRNTPNYAVMFGGAKTGDVSGPPYYPCNDVYFIENYIHNSYKDGVHFFGGSRILVAFNKFENLIDDAIAFGADKNYPVSDVVVTHNIGRQLNLQWSNFVKLHCGWNNLAVPASGIFNRIIVANNTAIQIAGKFFVISPENTNYSHNGMVQNLVVKDNTTDNTILLAAVTGAIVEGNTCASISVTNQFYSSSALGKAQNIKIIGNYCGSISVKGGAQYISIYGNMINGGNYGIDVGGGSQYISIVGNVITGQTIAGMRVCDSDTNGNPTYVLVMGNLIDVPNAYNGISVGWSSGNMKAFYVYVIGNYILNATCYALTKDSNSDNIYFIENYAPIKGMIIVGSQTNIFVYRNIIAGITGSGMQYATIKQNRGYLTENSGVATISSGQTRVTVSHGLASAPSKVLVSPLAQPSGKIWVENITSSSFDIVTDTAPSSGLNVAWYAEV